METADARNESTETAGAVSMSPSTSLFDRAKFHAIAVEVEFEYGMGGLCDTVYENWAADICERYLSNAHSQDST